MERKIGEIFEHNGEWYQCADWAVNPCSKCDFDGEGICCDELPCTSRQRKDKKYVFFNKLEKVGEPFSCNYYGDKRLIMMQEYRAYDNNITSNEGIPMYFTDEKHTRIAIAIKQNQENMEEKKIKLNQEDIDYIRRKFKDITQDYIIQGCDKEKAQYEFGKLFEPLQDSDNENLHKNLKPFSLEAAKQGKPVCTRDGRKARIICFDLKDKNYPIAAAIQDKDGDESIRTYTVEGIYDKGEISGLDLMMLPEKHEGWVNIYKERCYATKEEAIKNKYDGATYVDTVKIKWEE